MSVTDDRPLATSANAPARRKRKVFRHRGAPQADWPAVPLAERVEAAERRLREQRSEALYEALSDGEVEAKIAVRRRIRALKLDQELRAAEDEVRAVDLETSRERSREAKAAAEEDRRRNEEAELLRWKQRAGDKAEQLTSKTSQLAETAKLLVLAKRAIIAGIVLLLAWSGVNVQQQMVPSGDTTDPLFWLSYGIDLTLGGLLALLMLTSAATARAGMDQRRERIKGWRLSRYMQEAAILAGSLLLNTASHLAHGELLLAAKAAVPPIMVGMLVWSYNHITSRLSDTLLALTDDLQTQEQLVSDLEEAWAELEQQHAQQEELQQRLHDLEATAQRWESEAKNLHAERDARPEVQLDDTTVSLMPHALRAFGAMASGALSASMLPDGGGVPSGGQLATYLRLPKAEGGRVRDLMKTLVRGDVRIVIDPDGEVAEQPRELVPQLSRAL